MNIIIINYYSALFEPVKEHWIVSGGQWHHGGEESQLCSSSDVWLSQMDLSSPGD